MDAGDGYWAFISYSHVDQDWARKVHRWLESYHLPKALVGRLTSNGTVPERLYPVFLDREEMAGAEDLGKSLKASLDAAKSLIVICSPRARTSSWVALEIEHFQKNRAGPVIPIIVAGSPSAVETEQQCLPTALYRYEGQAQLVCPDLRRETDGFDLAMLKTVAGILGLSVAELAQRDAKRRATRNRLAITGLTLALALVSALAAWAVVQRDAATEASRVASRERDRAMGFRLAEDGETKVRLLRPGGTVDGALRVLAAHQLNPGSEHLSAMQAVYTAMHSIVRIVVAGARTTASATSRTGQCFATAHDDGTIRLWSLDGETKPREVANTKLASRTKVLAVSDDCFRLAAISEEWYLTVLDGRLKNLNVSPEYLSPGAMAFSSKGELFVSANHFGVLEVWNQDSSKRTVRRMTTDALTSPERLALSPDGRMLATGHVDGSVQVLDLETLAPRFPPLLGHEFNITALEFSPDGSQILSGSADATVRRWNAVKGALIGSPVEGHRGAVLTIAFDRSGGVFATGSTDDTIRVWNASTGTQRGPDLRGHSDSVVSLWFDSNENHMVSSSKDGTVRVWHYPPRENVSRVVANHEGLLTTTVFSLDGKVVLTAGRDHRVKITHLLNSPVVLAELVNPGGQVESAALSPDSKQVAICSESDSLIRLWIPGTPGGLSSLDLGHTGRTKAVTYSPSGKWLASADELGNVRVWDLKRRRMVAELQHGEGRPGGVNAIAFSSDGKLLATGGTDGRVRAWKTDRWQERFNIRVGETNLNVWALAFERHTKLLAVATGGVDVLLIDPARGELLTTRLQGHTDGLFALSFSPTGPFLVSGGQDGQLRLWDSDLLKPVGEPIRGHRSAVRAASFGPDGATIVSGSFDGTARLWDVINSWRKEICSKLPREMTLAEWRDAVGHRTTYAPQCKP
jgi:WD40 repeat protein